MATLTIPYSFVAGTTIVPSEMNSNFGAVKTFVEALAAGTNIDAGAVTTAKLATATVQLLTPTGVINQYAGSTAPTGWLLCDGSAVSRSTYADLFAIVGTTYGVGNGSSTFNLPNLVGRVVVGRDASQTEFDVLGETGGAKTHTLATGEIPSHQHTMDHDHPAGTTSSVDLNHTHAYSGTVVGDGAHSHTITISDPGHGHDFDYQGVNRTSGGATTSVVGPLGSAAKFPVNSNTTGITASASSTGHSHTYSGNTGYMSANNTHTHTFDVAAYAGSTGATGGAGAHNNLQPYIVLNYIIKA
jgi:microcystin-dependent protein